MNQGREVRKGSYVWSIGEAASGGREVASGGLLQSWELEDLQWVYLILWLKWSTGSQGLHTWAGDWNKAMNWVRVVRRWSMWSTGDGEEEREEGEEGKGGLPHSVCDLLQSLGWDWWILAYLFPWLESCFVFKLLYHSPRQNFTNAM